MTGHVQPAEAAWERYREEKPRYDAAAIDLEAKLKALAADCGMLVDVSVRAKDLGEFARKIARKEYTEDPYNQVTDKLGARIVVERSGQVDRLVQAAKDSPEFCVLSTTDTRGADPEKLQYGGVHLQAQLQAGPDHAEALEFELQVRTKAQHLWAATISHRLLYKQSVEIPKMYLRRPLRLIALMELWDEELERIMDDIPNVPGFAATRLRDLAVRAYLSFAPTLDFDEQLSAETVAALSEVVDMDTEVYEPILAEFIRTHAATLQLVLRDYGPPSGEFAFRYLLFWQPEIVIIYERLYAKPEALWNAWIRAGLREDLLLTAADVLGRPYALQS